MDSPLVLLLLVWFFGIPAAVLLMATVYPRWVSARIVRARRRAERRY
jgi:hypothetical protein